LFLFVDTTGKLKQNSLYRKGNLTAVTQSNSRTG